MNGALLKKLPAVTDEEKRILAGQRQIDSSLSKMRIPQGMRDKLIPWGISFQTKCFWR